MSKVDLAKAMAELDEDTVVAGVKDQLAAGVSAAEILGELQQGMEKIGKMFETGEYYLSELIMSADVFSTASGLLSAALTTDGNAKAFGTMVLGTVKDDIHDIGKNIVATIMNCNGFKVVDLGVDAPIASFVAAVKANKPQVVGMCCLLTTAFDVMKETVAAVKEADPSVKILVGGGPVNEDVRKYVGADGYCKDAYSAVDAAKKAVGLV
jgi:methanogenic corrinoid protein MtbC1